METDPVPCLDEMIHRIVGCCHPQAIWLFGSRAEGRHHCDADVDLLIVLPDAVADRRRLGIRLHQLLADLPVAKDLVLSDQRRFHERSSVWGTLEYEAAHHGRVIHGHAA